MTVGWRENVELLACRWSTWRTMLKWSAISSLSYCLTTVSARIYSQSLATWRKAARFVIPSANSIRKRTRFASLIADSCLRTLKATRTDDLWSSDGRWNCCLINEQIYGCWSRISVPSFVCIVCSVRCICFTIFFSFCVAAVLINALWKSFFRKVSSETVFFSILSLVDETVVWDWRFFPKSSLKTCLRCFDC